MKLNGSQPFEELMPVYQALISDKPTSFEECVRSARLLWQENYHNNIEQLLYNFPPDQMTSNGVPFWSGSKRCPHSLTFACENATCFDFVFTAANLKAEMYGLAQCRDRKRVVEMVRRVQVPDFKPKQGIKIDTNDSEEPSATENSANFEQGQLDSIASELRAIAAAATSIVVVPIEFEKDNDTNMHMDFIVACSNLRAENYDIAPADRHKSKLIAGRIIPAIATTTSLIVGLDCIEVYKLVQGHRNIDMYKNSFVNLAVPLFALSQPVAPNYSKFYETTFSQWDRIEVNGEMTLREFLAHFKKVHSLEVTIVSHGAKMLFAFFMDKQKLAERIGMT